MWFSCLVYLPLAAAWTLIMCQAVTGSTPHQHGAKTVREREGESAVLGCNITLKEEDWATQVIEWMNKGLVLPIFIKFGHHPPRIDGAYLGRLSLVQGASLRLNRLRSSDEGWYYCRILFLTQPYDSHNGSWVYLSVSTPPSLRRTPPPVLEILLGEPAHLRCEAGGRPEPLISWSKDGQMLPPPAGSPDGQRYQVTNGSLKIEAVDRGSAGIYTCEARNEEGAVTHSTRLLILGPPTIIVPPGNVTVNYTQDARFSCQAEAYPGNLTYSWFKDGVNVHRHSSLHYRVSVLSDGSLLVRDTVPLDSGSYTCVPSNGLALSPKASGILRILYPAYVQSMPRLTVLPMGMQGHIPCPVMANPPLLYVNWTKNGAALELNKIPGWYQDSAGTIVIAIGNDDALGEYTCTPYNSYGTLGQSSPTHVILKDPPRFVNRPAKRYVQEVGRELRISCSARGDPEPVVTWNKAGGCSRCPFQVLEDGTLSLRSLRECHHGDWVCEGRNNLTHITAWTTVLVLGTSPHAVRNVTVRPDVFAITVSWEPGFDGGQPQQFTVWFRQMTHGPHDWIIRMVPTGNSSLRVGGLWPDTEYQFSVLAQSERGSGPFSPILNIWTLGVPMTMATPVTEWASILLPPQDLTANRTARGILLCWVPPPPPSRLPLGYLLEFRWAGDWAVLHSAIPAQQNQLLLKGLVKNVCYQLRMISLSEDLVSEPSNIINVSTAGMSSYPDGNRILEPLSHSVRAGIIAGACFLACAVIVSVLVSYIMKMRRERRRQNSPIIFSRFQKAPNLERSDSPDSLLTLKLESSLYESLERVSVSPRGGGLFEGKRARYEAHLGRLETIRRGPDGRFVVPRELGSGRPRPSPPGPGPVAEGGPGHRLRRPGPPGEEVEGRGPPPGLGPTRAGFACSAPQGPRLPGGGAAGPQASVRCRPHPEWPVPRGPAGQSPSSARSSQAAGSSPAHNSSGYHSGNVSWRVSEERDRDRRESRAGGCDEWETGMTMSSEILEALRLHQRTRRPHSSIVLHDLPLTGSSASSELKRSRTVQSLEVPGAALTLRQSRPSTESRCAALREEFQEYRRQKEMEKSERSHGKGVSSVGSLELATLL